MNPTSRTKPLMDVAVSKKPAQAHIRRTVSGLMARRSALPARPVRSSLPAAPAPTAAVRPVRGQQAAAPVVARHHAPVALITVTVFAVLVLSTVGVVLYVTLRAA